MSAELDFRPLTRPSRLPPGLAAHQQKSPRKAEKGIVAYPSPPFSHASGSMSPELGLTAPNKAAERPGSAPRTPPGLGSRALPGMPPLDGDINPNSPKLHERLIYHLREYKSVATVPGVERETKSAHLVALMELLHNYYRSNDVLDFGELRTGESMTNSIQMVNTAPAPTKFSFFTIIPPREEFSFAVRTQKGGKAVSSAERLVELSVEPKQELVIEVNGTGGKQYGLLKAHFLVVVNDAVVIIRALTMRVKPTTTFDFGEALYAEPYVPKQLQHLSDVQAPYRTEGLMPPFPNLHERMLEGVPSFPALVNELQTSTLAPELPEPVDENSHWDDSVSPTNYFDFFCKLLATERVAQHERYARQQLFNAAVVHDPATTAQFQSMGLNPCPIIAVVEIPGVVDDQPRVNVGDNARIRLQRIPFDGVDHIAHVWSVDRRSQRVYLAIGPHFPFMATYNVRLEPDRQPFYNASRALKFLSETDAIKDWLFPSTTEEPALAQASGPAPMPTIGVYNERLNYEQRLSVQRIVEDQYGRVPFLIFGPPGTGKTSTVVEAILQVLQHRPDARILATAPSNSAADTILNRLIPHLQPNQMFRLNNPSRTFAELTDEMLPYTFSQHGYFAFPDKAKLLQCRVVVSTCFDAAYLVHVGLSNTQYEASFAAYHQHARALFPAYHPEAQSVPHWTHCFVDECGQATEPEICVPLSVVYRNPPKTGAAEIDWFPQAILCGDHRQLGPRIVSDFARKNGLKKSLLERLKDLPLYSREVPGRVPPFVHLRRNYRSHPGILMMPSHLFYSDSLLPFADERVTQSLVDWTELKGSELPIAFYGVIGKDEGIGNGDSWYNDDEIAKVVDIVDSLLSQSSLGVKQSDFGIIAPFREQVRRIRIALRKRKWSGINVGTVELPRHGTQDHHHFVCEEHGTFTKRQGIRHGTCA